MKCDPIKGIGFVSLQESPDTTTSGGKLVFHVFGALAEFERLIIERTKAGLKAARARGSLAGRPKKLNRKQIRMAKRLFEDKDNKTNEIAKTLNISRSTLYRYRKGENNNK
jgi:DNA invertase Pin-like site-specific DNA recombinase